jgi:hypothetical protein
MSMRALTVIPLQAGSAEVADMPEPEPGPGELLIDAEALARADRSWLERMITRRVPLEDFGQAFEKQPGDVKVVLDL